MAEQQSLSRRKFLTYAGIGVAGLAATGAAVKIVSDQLATDDSTAGGGGPAVPTEIRNDKCLWGAYVDPGTGSAIGAVEIQWLDQQQLAALVARVLLRGHQFSDYARDQHGLFLSLDMDFVDDA